MSEEEINKIFDNIPKVNVPRTISDFNSVNIEYLKSAMKRLNKIPNPNDLLKENKNLQQRIDKAIDYIEENTTHNNSNYDDVKRVERLWNNGDGFENLLSILKGEDKE